MSTNSETYNKILDYIDNNSIATLSTINIDGSPHGAAVYVCADDSRRVVYFLTKTGTRKYKNLSERNQVSLTIVNPSENSSLQANGRAFVTRDTSVIDMVVKKINRAYAGAADWLPPISQLHAGPYVMVGIEIWHARLAEFDGMKVDNEHIFTQA